MHSVLPPRNMARSGAKYRHHVHVSHSQALSTLRAARFAASAQQRDAEILHRPDLSPARQGTYKTGWSRHQIRQASSSTARSPAIILRVCDRNI